MPKKLPTHKNNKQPFAQAERPPLARFLLAAFLDWQREAGKTRSQVEFAKHLGLKRSTLTKMMLGRVEVPERDQVEAIASKLGDGIYDILGLDRPDPLLQAIIASWGDLTIGQQQELVKRAGIDVRAFIGRADSRVADVEASSKNGAGARGRARSTSKA